MKRISHIFLSGGVSLILLATACAPVEGLPGALQQDLTASPTTPATTDPSQATATNTTLTPSIPVTGLEVILLNCPYCVDNIAHDQLLIPREATFRVTSPPELVRGDDDDDDDGEGGRRRTAQLTGAAEVPGPGDPDGSGTATIRLQLEQGEVCFDLTVSNIGPATAAHIHEGAEGVAGPVVVPLDPAPTGGSSSGCISDVDAALIQNIAQNPGQYYVNVHNEEFPDGAIRGQLGRVDDDDNGNNNNNDNDDDDNGDNEDDDGEDDDEDDDENGDRLGCRVIDRFRDKKLVLCRAEENTTITMNVCLDDNNCTEVKLTLQACALTATPSPVVTATQTITPTGTAATFTPVPSTATVTATSPTSTATSTPVAPATGTPTPTGVTNTPIASSTNTTTPTPTSTPTP